MSSPTLKKEKGKRGEEEKGDAGGFGFHFLERESLPSLYVYERSDRRQSSGQEGKLLYAERASRGYQI